MRLAWTDKEWLAATFYLLAPLLVATGLVGYWTVLIPIQRLALLAPIYGLLVAVALRRWRSTHFRIAGGGVVVVSITLLVPSLMPPSASAHPLIVEIEVWGQALFLLGGGMIATGSLLHTLWLLRSRFSKSDPRRHPASATRDRMPQSKGVLSVLAIESDPMEAARIQEIVAQEGHLIVTVATGQEALEELRTGEFDLVMAAGIGDYQLATAIKKTAKDIPVIALMGFGDAAQTSSGMRSMDLVLGKPVTRAKFQRAISSIRKAPVQVPETGIRNVQSDILTAAQADPLAQGAGGTTPSYRRTGS